MNESATTARQPAKWEDVDVVDLEARLNAIANKPDCGEVSATANEKISLLEQFLSEPDMQTLTSRSKSKTACGDAVEVHVQCSRLTFAAAQTRQVLHISFSPDLAETPDVEATLIDTEGRIRVTHRTRFGVRLEVSISETTGSSSTAIVETICSAVTPKN